MLRWLWRGRHKFTASDRLPFFSGKSTSNLNYYSTELREDLLDLLGHVFRRVFRETYDELGLGFLSFTFLKQGDAEMISEGWVVGILLHQATENLNSAVVEPLLRVNPAECICNPGVAGGFFLCFF